MRITIKTKNLELTPELESFVQKKIGSVKKFLGSFQNHHLPVAGDRDLFETFVEVEKETNHHRKGDIFRAEAKIYVPGRSLFAKVHGEEIMKLVNELRDELESEIRKYKTRVIEFPIRKAKKTEQKKQY